MSRDIRSFFSLQGQSKKVQKNDKSIAKDKDSDVIPPTPTPKKEKVKKKRKVISSDSEESDKEFVKSKPQKSSANIANSTAKKLTEVKAVDIFGSTPAKRVKKNDSVDGGTELGVHDDRNFENTLISLDEEFSKHKNLKNGNAESKNKKSDIEQSKKSTTDKRAENGDSNISPRKRPVELLNNGKDQNNSNYTEKAKTSTISCNLESKKATSKIKTDFSSFIDDENIKKDKTPKKTLKNDSVQTDKTPETQNKRKRKLSETTPEITEEERIERKRHSALLYKNYLNRSGPKHHGSKEVPEGTPTCLNGCVFVVTGVLDSFERDEIQSIIKKFGGDTKQGITGKVTHMICGEDAGPAKVAKAEKLKVKIISEDEFLELIKTRSESKRSDPEITNKNHSNNKNKKSETPKKESKSNSNVKSKKLFSSPEKVNGSSKEDIKVNALPKKGVKLNNLPENKEETLKKEIKTKNKSDGSNVKKSTIKKETNATTNNEMNDIKLPKSTKNFYSDTSSNDNETKSTVPETETPAAVSNIPWVEKYRPKTLKQVIGQHGDASSASKLHAWLTKWYQCRKTKQPVPNPWSKGDGGYYKAVLLSGPPGVGKTTTATLVCKDLGFDIVEFNASDTRSKTLLKEQITELSTTNSLSGFIHGKKALTKKHAIIMDEVDGMAGNEDRGGMQELLSIIKHTSVPIICICNDKTSQKMRSLVSNCYDLTFNRPKVEQIRGAIKSICFKEKIKVPPDYLDEIIMASSQDLRQIINTLSMWSATQNTTLTKSEDEEMKVSKKDMKLGPWAVVKTVFTEDEHKKMSLYDKSDLFFHDYSLGPLFVHQNYLKVVPHCPKKDHLQRFAEAADSISIGDLVEAKIRSGMSWSLLPVQAMYSSVIPGERLSGHIQGMIDFPGWLGQNSRTNKMNRLAQEIHAHTRLSTTGSKESIRLDYASHLSNAVLNPLISKGSDGIEESVEVLQTYHLLREDLDSLLELSSWSGKSNKFSQVETKVKTALTKKYNKEAAPLPYTQINIKKKQLASKESEIDEFAEEQENEPDLSDSDVENDAMIKKAKKPPASANPNKKQKKTEVKAKPGPSKKK